MSLEYRVVVLVSGNGPFEEWRVKSVSMDSLDLITQGTSRVQDVKATYQTFKYAKVVEPGDEMSVAREKRAIIEKYRQFAGDPEDSDVLYLFHHQDFGMMKEQSLEGK